MPIETTTETLYRQTRALIDASLSADDLRDWDWDMIFNFACSLIDAEDEIAQPLARQLADEITFAMDAA